MSERLCNWLYGSRTSSSIYMMPILKYESTRTNHTMKDPFSQKKEREETMQDVHWMGFRNKDREFELRP